MAENSHVWVGPASSHRFQLSSSAAADSWTLPESDTPTGSASNTLPRNLQTPVSPPSPEKWEVSGRGLFGWVCKKVMKFRNSVHNAAVDGGDRRRRRRRRIWFWNFGVCWKREINEWRGVAWMWETAKKWKSSTRQLLTGSFQLFFFSFLLLFFKPFEFSAQLKIT